MANREKICWDCQKRDSAGICSVSNKYTEMDEEACSNFEQKIIYGVIYNRVSPTRRKKNPGELHSSLMSANRICQALAAQEGIIILEVYNDEYISGKNAEKLPELNRMLKEIIDPQSFEGKQISKVVSRRVDRFTRDYNGTMEASIELNRHGISLRFIEPHVDTTMNMGRAILAFLAELAELRRKDIIHDIKRGREEYVKNGGKFGVPKKELSHDTVTKLRNFRLMPASNRPTWKEIEGMQMFWINGKPTSVSTLIRVLKDHGYWDEKNRRVI